MLGLTYKKIYKEDPTGTLVPLVNKEIGKDKVIQLGYEKESKRVIAGFNMKF